MERILGVNLSGWFIPEPWVTPSLYAATGASNAAELQEAMGTAATNERMRRHYETFVSEDEEAGIVPVGAAAADPDEALRADIRAALEEGEPASAVAKRLSQKYSRRKRDVYAMVLDMQ